jgi:hypothetical protein
MSANGIHLFTLPKKFDKDFWWIGTRALTNLFVARNLTGIF